MPRPILVSACLLGLNTRYDGQSKGNPKVLRYLADHDLIPVPVCPEQLAGQPTPRPATRFTAGHGALILTGEGAVTNIFGHDLTEVFLRGAEATLEIARLTGCRDALLKERSPSCGVHRVYLGERLIPGQGVASALLQRQGLNVFSEEDL